jgi:RNA polymerase sigma-70 factor (ECF subfamily)
MRATARVEARPVPLLVEAQAIIAGARWQTARASAAMSFEHDDATSLQRAREGDRAALERLMAAHYAGLRAFVRLRLAPDLRQKEAVSDVVQSACREVLCNLGRFEYHGEAGFRAWLYTTALHKVREKFRFWHAHKRDLQLEVSLTGSRSGEAQAVSACYASVLSPSRQALAAEEVVRLEDAFARLTEEEREVITLSRIAKVPHAEIAARLGRSPGAVRTRVCRALARLSRILAEQEARGGVAGTGTSR